MLRIIKNANLNKIIVLLQNIYGGINSILEDYNFLFNPTEISLLSDTMNSILEQLNHLNIGNIDYDKIYSILLCEKILKPLFFRCWNFEKHNGCNYISWFKNDKIGEMPSIVSATFSRDRIVNFCEARYGIKYEVEIDGFLGACCKDAATLIEDKSRKSIYTIGELENGMIVNSYNLATLTVTPIQIISNESNDYKSKHNEIILDSRFIKPLSVVYTDSNDFEMVTLISSKYNIPIEFIGESRNI